MRRAVVAVLVLGAYGLFGCKTGPEKAAEPKTEQQKVVNIGYFDLKNCWPGVVDLGKPVTMEALVGFLVSTRPELNECFVDPKDRGPDKVTHAIIKATVSDQGVNYDVTGENLTPAGTECIKRVLKERGGIEPLAQGAQPVEGQIDFQHQVGTSPGVVMGINESSDVIGTIRLQLPKWCECFEPWKAAAPHTLRGNLELAKAQPTPVSVTFDPSQDADTTRVQACLAEKIKVTPLPHTSEKLMLPVPLYFLHSGVNEGLPSDVRPEIQFLQLDAIRTQRSADVAMALGTRGAAASAWDKLVKDYQAQVAESKKSKKKVSITVDELKKGCASLLAADDTWIAAVEKQVDNEDRTLKFAQEHSSSDPRWADVATAATDQVKKAQEDLSKAKEIRTTDAQGCPKERY